MVATPIINNKTSLQNKVPNMENLDKKDIQGIIVRGYSNLPAACFMLISIKDAEPAKYWLNQLIPDITPALHKPNEYAVHVAFTFDKP